MMNLIFNIVAGTIINPIMRPTQFAKAWGPVAGAVGLLFGESLGRELGLSPQVWNALLFLASALWVNWFPNAPYNPFMWDGKINRRR